MLNKKLQKLLEEIAAKRNLKEEELGSAAAEPVHTEEEPKEHTPAVSQDEVHAGEQAAEEVKAPLIEEEEMADEVVEAAQEAEEEIADKGELDYEGDMASGQLKVIIDAAVELHNMLEDNEDANLPEWVQSKLTLAKDYIDKVRDYMKSEVAEDVQEEIKDSAEGGEDVFSKEEIEQVMESLNLDTHKYTFEYLAEQLGFKPLSEAKKLGSAAAKPKALKSSKPAQHKPVASNKDVVKGQHAQEVKAPLIEAVKSKKQLKVKVTPKKNVILDNKGQLKQDKSSVTPVEAVVSKAGK